MDISLIITPICLKTCVYVPWTYMKGSVSDTGLSFCFIVFSRWKSEGKKYKKLQKLPVFSHKLKLRPKQKT